MTEIIEHCHHRSACLPTTSTRCQSHVIPFGYVISDANLIQYFEKEKLEYRFLIKFSKKALILRCETQ